VHSWRGAATEPVTGVADTTRAYSTAAAGPATPSRTADVAVARRVFNIVFIPSLQTSRGGSIHVDAKSSVPRHAIQRCAAALTFLCIPNALSNALAQRIRSNQPIDNAGSAHALTTRENGSLALGPLEQALVSRAFFRALHAAPGKPW
jgi:hypothetical protein